MKKLLKVLITSCFLVITSSSLVFAYTYPIPDDWKNIWGALNGAGTEVAYADFLEVNDGIFSYTGVGFEADHQNKYDLAGPGNKIYDNWNGAQGYNYGIWSAFLEYESTFFKDTTDDDPKDRTHVVIFKLDEDWEFGDTTWEKNTYILGWGDGASDQDYDDLIIAAKTPEPTTILLFGVGLLGLAGIGRRKE